MSPRDIELVELRVIVVEFRLRSGVDRVEGNCSRA
jgi:hypothetical protein